MMKRDCREWIVASGALLLLGLGLLATGCSEVEPGCRTTDDCRSGRVCVERACLSAGELPDTWTGGENHNPIEFNHSSGSDAGELADGSVGTPDVSQTSDVGPHPEDISVPLDVGSPDPDVSEPQLGPKIRVIPSGGVTFGRVPVNMKITTELLVENTGDAPLSLTELDLEVRPSLGFAVDPSIRPASPQILQPGERRNFDVSFEPGVTSQYQNGVNVRSDDADDPDTYRGLAGRGGNLQLTPCIGASPNALDFGDLEIGEEAELTVTVFNCSSTTPVQITAVEISGSATGPFQVTPAQAVPFSIQPGRTGTVTVSFAPGATGNPRETLSFRGDVTLNQLARVQLGGSGVEP
ncbi:MAG: choice-of-anchor D domain-containing protein [Bradymonadaceae bacterium]